MIDLSFTVDDAERALRIIFDNRPAHTKTGIGRYTRLLSNLLNEGVAGHDCWQLDGSMLALRAQTPLEEEFELPMLLEREDAGLLHSPLFRLPAILPCPAVITLHDAIPAVRPDLTPPEFARLFDAAAEAAARAVAVVCPSEHAKADVVRSLGVPARKVRVIPEAPDSSSQLVGPKRGRARVR
jgi:glycosyltransferase involved in cell wall biosynthesis